MGLKRYYVKMSPEFAADQSFVIYDRLTAATDTPTGHALVASGLTHEQATGQAAAMNGEPVAPEDSDLYYYAVWTEAAAGGQVG